MVKSNKSVFQENRNTQSFTENCDKVQKINASTADDTCKRAANLVWRNFSPNQVFGFGRFSANICCPLFYFCLTFITE
jgi:hypothetical protein